MIKKLKHIIVAGLLVLGVGMVLVPTNSYAVNVIADQCKADPSAAICKDAGATPNKLISTIVNVLLFIVGVLSVIMLIVGGLMYTSSAGDSGRITMAKNTIMYAIVGLVVSFVAYAVVNYVVSKFQ